MSTWRTRRKGKRLMCGRRWVNDCRLPKAINAAICCKVLANYSISSRRQIEKGKFRFNILSHYAYGVWRTREGGGGRLIERSFGKNKSITKIHFHSRKFSSSSHKKHGKNTWLMCRVIIENYCRSRKSERFFFIPRKLRHNRNIVS